ncbi:hypothetical protein Tco_1065859 [Tanacetum coccineum]
MTNLATTNGPISWTKRNLVVFTLTYATLTKIHYILLGLSSNTKALWKLSCLLEATRQSLACIRLGLRGQSCLHALRDCWPLPPEETAAPYLLSKHYSLVIASGPEVAFVTLAIPVDRSNMEWFCLRNIRS